MTQLTVALPPLHRTPRKSCNFLFSLHFATINLYSFVRNICLKTNNNTCEKNFEKCLSIHVFYYVFALNKLRRNTGENSSLFYIGNQSQISCSILSFNELFFLQCFCWAQMYRGVYSTRQLFWAGNWAYSRWLTLAIQR